MKINNYLNILNLNKKYNISNIHKLNIDELKKAYHISALLYHPDKNNNHDAKQKFQELNNAYIQLKLYINNFNKDNNTNENENENENENDFNYDQSYVELITEFINILITNEKLNKNIVDKFKDDCINYSNTIIDNLLDKLNIDSMQEIHKIISKIYKTNNNINIPDYLYNYITTSIEKKFKSVNIFILNPNLDNLFKNEIFKLEIDNETICIPLWHNELNYDKNIIKIEPILENNIIIDEYNNIHISYNNSYENLIKSLKNDEVPHIEIIINKYNLMIPLNEIFMKKYQTYVFKNIGIPVINTKNIFDNSKLSNIIVHINLS